MRLKRPLVLAGLTAAAMTWTIAPSGLQGQVTDTADVRRGGEGVPGGPVSFDSASRLRAEMERPPARPPADVYDLLSFPLRLAMLPLAMVGRGVQTIASLAFADRPPNPVVVAYGDLREWGLVLEGAGFGPRGGPGGEVRLERFAPFFLESGISIRGSQRHLLGLEAGAGDGPNGTVVGGFRRYAEPHFWGIGPHTEEEAAADFRWDRVELAGRGELPTGPVALRLELGYETNEVGRGSDHDDPDLLDVAPPGLFGLAEETRFARIGVGARLDRTWNHVFQPRGFLADLGSTFFLGTGETDADFVRWTAELVGYVPLNPRQQLALRGLGELNRELGGRGVPFTHLAALGGSRVNRGFDAWRFRDLDLLAAQAEWRFEVWRSFREDLRQEALLFLDAGTVTGPTSELASSPLHTSWGFGMRTADRDGVLLLWFLAFGEETRFGVKLSWPF